MNEKKILSTLKQVEEYMTCSKNKEKEIKIFDLNSYLLAVESSTIDRTEINCINFYKKHLMDFSLSSEVLSQIFLSLYRCEKKEAVDMYTRWLHGIKFLYSGNLDNLLCAIDLSCKSKDFDPLHKFDIAAYLYELGYIGNCYDIFLNVLSSEGVDPITQSECCKYLYVSENEKYKETLKKDLKRILSKDSCLSSETKVGIILSLSSKTVRVLSRQEGIKTEQDVAFLAELHKFFVFDDSNDKKDIILACDFLLKYSSEEDVTETENLLMTIGKNLSCSEQIRASAYDKIYLSGKNKVKIAEAFMALKDLGMDSTTKKLKTIYDSSQNVHSQSIDESISVAY